MFIRVKHGDNQTMLVNPNCSIKLIHQYIILKVGINNKFEIDLFDEGGSLKRIYSYPPTTFGLEILKQRATYILMVHARLPNGQLSNPLPLLSKNSPLYNEILAKLKKSLCKSAGRKKSSGSRKTSSSLKKSTP